MITRLNRLGRSVLHLVTLGAQLRERRVGLRVIEQGIDTLGSITRISPQRWVAAGIDEHRVDAIHAAVKEWRIELED